MKRVMALVLLSVWLLPPGGCASETSVKAVEPNFGNISGNDDVVIIGSGFKTGMTVQFGKHEVKNVVLDNTHRLRVKTPPGAEGKVDVIVTGEDGRTFVLHEGFTYRREVTSSTR